MARTSTHDLTQDARAAAARNAGLEFASVYNDWFHEVERWVRALGAPDADREDLAQEVFIVVRRKMNTFDGRNLAGWLYAITRLTVKDHGRRAWMRHLFKRRAPMPEDAASPADTPAMALERQEERRLLQQILSRMNPARRETFALFELSGYSGEEIAALQEIPLNTVWTRLHYARKEFMTAVEALRQRERGKDGR